MTFYTSQQAHDDITALFDAYYDAKKADVQSESIPPNKRVESADAIVERYIEVNGKRPPKGVLGRLATYILLDVLSDPHPDKMSRDEYPIASYRQTGRYRLRRSFIRDEPYSQEDVIGSVASREIDEESETSSTKGPLLNVESGEQRARDWRLFLREVLSEREYFIIEGIYEKGMTQAEVAAELGVSDRWVRHLFSEILDKLRKYYSN